MATAHVCHVDCKLGKDEHGRTFHMMYAAEPSSAAGRYQWEQNREILDRGRRAWRESGQGQSRECRVWDRERAEHVGWGDDAPMFGIRAGYRASLYGVTA